MAPKLQEQQEHLRALAHALEKCTEWVKPEELAAAEEKIDQQYEAKLVIADNGDIQF